MRFALTVLLLGCALSAPANPDQPTANPEASPSAKSVLKYIQSLRGRSDKRLVTGQFTDYGSNASTRIMGQIERQSGVCPAIFGVDYADWHDGSIKPAAPNAAAIEHWRKGGLVTITAHFFNPLRTNVNVSGLRDRKVDVTPLLDAQSPAHAVWMTELDQIAAGLQELRDAGVVVLWRPFHEMNGGWFWWGAQKPGVFIRLWREMFDYFTHEKKLNNLLWVYGPNHGGKTVDYYPGDSYVDLVGVDAYGDTVDPEHFKGTAELRRLPKPFGFSEFGPHGPVHPPGNYDYLRFINGVEKNFPETVFFMAWSVNWGLTTNKSVTELLHHPWMVNRADLPSWTGSGAPGAKGR